MEDTLSLKSNVQYCSYMNTLLLSTSQSNTSNNIPYCGLLDTQSQLKANDEEATTHQWYSYTGAHWGIGPTIRLHGPTIKIFPYHVIQLIIVVP